MADSKTSNQEADRGLVDPRPREADPWGDAPTTENDGGESAIAGRSREHHPGVPEQVDDPDQSTQTVRKSDQLQKQQELIDDALKATFPASDPPSFMGGVGRRTS